MKSLNEYITVDESGQGSLRPNNREELEDLIMQRIDQYGDGPECNLNDIDVSKITDMSDLFCDMEFNGDISEWDVSRVKDMSHMFDDSTFNGDLSKWDVSRVENMNCMFSFSRFDGISRTGMLVM